MIKNRYAILIASSIYQDSNLDCLVGPENDVDGLDEILKSQDYGKFCETHVLKNENRYSVLERIEEIFGKVNKDDLVLIYYSGHGKQDGNGKLYLTTKDTKINLLKSTSIPLDIIKIMIEDSKTNKVVLILDCCLSGLAAKAFLRGSADSELQSLSSARGTYILSASTGLQVAREAGEYGVFTKHIIDGIRDWKAANEDGNVTMDSLYSYVNSEMLAEGSQKPMKWDLNVQGELIIASSGRSKRNERAKEIREMLLELSHQGFLPDSILIKALPIINKKKEKLSQEEIEYDKLLDRFSQKLLGFGPFIDEWKLIEYEQKKKTVSKSDRPESSLTEREEAINWFEKGSNLADQGKTEEALRAYEKAIELDPKFARPWNGKGAVFHDLGKTEEALKAFEKAIELDPKFSRPWNGKGVVLGDQGNKEDALKAYEKAIELDPKFAMPWYNIGNDLRDQGKKEEALKAYEKAIELDLKYAYPWNGKGNVFGDQGKTEEALKAYEKAIELDPKFAHPWYNKGLALKSLGRKSQADECFARAKELGYKG